MKIKILAFLSFLWLMACDPVEPDTSAPTLEVLSATPSIVSDSVCGVLEENNVIRLRSGQTLTMQLRFADNEALSQYKVDIHSNFDCHGHRGPSTTDWQELRLVDLEGTAIEETLTLTVPNDVTAGSYHFQILAIDASGNETDDAKYYSLLVNNMADTIPPELRVDQPASSPVQISKGSILTVTGQALDNALLDGGRLELVYFTPSGNRATADVLNFDSSHGSDYNFTFNYSVPMTFSSGDYEFELRIYDAVGNSYFSPSFVVTVQ